MGTSILINPLNIVLLIADNFIDNYVHRKLLDSLGVAKKYMEFSDPLEAIGYLKLVHNLYDKSGENSIDLIIFDMNVSNMEATEFIKQVEIACDIEIPKLILISEAFYHDEVKQLKSNDLVNGFIQKPLDHNKIVDCFKAIPSFPIDPSGIHTS